MKFSISAISLALAVTASAVPIEEEQHAERSTITGSGPGSIFQFGSASKCRTIFWNSGACGLSTFFANKVSASMPLVALPSRIFEAHGSSDQDNPLCAKIITMKHNGVTRQAVISDENTSDEQSIDMCLDLWQAFGGHDGDGTLIENISWSIAA